LPLPSIPLTFNVLLLKEKFTMGFWKKKEEIMGEE